MSRKIDHKIWENPAHLFGAPDRQKALENQVMATAEKTFKLEL
jgi:hypothetical protein